MNHQAVSKSARKKANKLYDEVGRLFESEEVKTIFKRMNMKLLAVKKSLFDTEVQLTVEDYKIYTASSSKLHAIGTETSSEASKQKREIEDDQMVANMKLICQYHNEFYVNDSLIDLRPNSNFTKKLPSSLLKPYFKELDDKIEDLIPSNVHTFLTEFFKQNLSDSDWNIKIDDLQCS
ncbi:hypothetical protein Glove_18g126 [Diversispora epigaea]|uniref:Uncharacterized protein n=1 Tax=Diversispora epigaea TaxID=1348612 RepID=A0A397JWE0_9GLOM|nr:hypothetical protein Glove_18g126 [Diversispora epigaea]